MPEVVVVDADLLVKLARRVQPVRKEAKADGVGMAHEQPADQVAGRHPHFVEVHLGGLGAALPEFFLKLLTDPGDIILDPFAGSGSTIAACEAMGVAGIGVEKNKKYFELSKKAVPKLAAIHIEEMQMAMW